MQNVLQTQGGVVAHMSASTNENDWNNRCDDVKAANNGYPPFWFSAIVLSGVAEKTAQKWNGNANLHISSF